MPCRKEKERGILRGRTQYKQMCHIYTRTVTLSKTKNGLTTTKKKETNLAKIKFTRQPTELSSQFGFFTGGQNK